MMKAIALGCAMLLLAACGTTPSSNHYLLDTRVESIAQDNSPTLGVGPVEVPGYLRREQLVYRLDSNQIEIENTERWAEPLESGIGRVVSLNLAGLLGTNSVQTFPYHHKRAPDFGVKLNVHNLDGGPAGATLVVEWLLYRPASGEQLERRLTRLHTELASGTSIIPQLPAAYSELLWRLSEEIAGEIENRL